LINDQRAQKMRIQAQVMSMVIPLAILGLLGGVMVVMKKRKYVKN
jgi:hypothetical protein